MYWDHALADQVRKILAAAINRGDVVKLTATLAMLQAECLGRLIEERSESCLAAARQVAAAAGHRARCLTMTQAAEQSGILECTLREAGRRGDLPVVHIGRSVYVRQESLERWITAREQKR